MKKIKTIFCIILLVSAYGGFAQGIQLDTTRFQRKNYLSIFTLEANKLPLDAIKHTTSNQRISVFNQTTGLNDYYSIYNNTTNYTHSNIDFRNNMRGMKIDSFNPNGTKDIGLSVAVSLFSLLLE